MFRKRLNAELGRLTPQAYKEQAKIPVVLVLDNIRSQHNIGAAFRTADAFAIEGLVLCGISACPPSAEIHKAALGAEDSVDWTYQEDCLEAVRQLKAAGYTLLSVEQAQGAVSLEQFSPRADEKYALVFGNEVRGVQQEVVDAGHGALEIPQFGTKHSLNVSVSIGVVLWDFSVKLRAQ